MHAAAAAAQLPCVQSLLEARAAVNAQTKKGETPVALAATDGLPEKENAVNLAASGTSSVDWGKEELRAPEMMTPLLTLMVE